MVLLGIALVLLALAVGYLLVVGASQLTDTVSIPVLQSSLDLPPLALVLAGAGAMLLLWLGWVLVRVGSKRGARRRREAKAARQQAADEQSAREQQMRDELAARDQALAEERRLREAEAARRAAESPQG